MSGESATRITPGNAFRPEDVAAQVAQDDVELLWKYLENTPGGEITVDLTAKTIVAGDITCTFHVDDYTRWRLLEGLDDIGLTMRHEQDVTDFEAQRPSFKPVTQPS